MTTHSDSLKKLRLKNLKQNKNFIFKKIDISNRNQLCSNFLEKKKIDVIFNLAAQAGVRYSLIKPDSYFFSNLIGFLNICDLAKLIKSKKSFFCIFKFSLWRCQEISSERDIRFKPKEYLRFNKKNE